MCFFNLFANLCFKCSFGRIIIRLDSSQKKIIQGLTNTVRKINATALGLDKYNAQVQMAAISTHKLTQ